MNLLRLQKLILLPEASVHNPDIGQERASIFAGLLPEAGSTHSPRDPGCDREILERIVHKMRKRIIGLGASHPTSRARASRLGKRLYSRRPAPNAQRLHPARVARSEKKSYGSCGISVRRPSRETEDYTVGLSSITLVDLIIEPKEENRKARAYCFLF
jgi:hypothetical protein